MSEVAQAGARAQPRKLLMHVTTVPQTLFFLSGQPGFMRQSGIDTVVVASAGPALQEFSEEEAVEAFVVPMARRVTPLRDLASILCLLKLIRRLRPEIVHGHTPKGGLIAMIAATLARTPFRVYHIHGLPFVTASGIRRLLLLLTERVSCALADRVLCVSESVRSVAKGERIGGSAITVLLGGSINGVDAAVRFNPERCAGLREATRRRLGIPLDAAVVGFVGRIVREKGVVELADAWRHVRASHAHAHLLILGSSEPQDPVPDAVWESLASDPRVHLAGDDRETPQYFAAMDIVALPTYREGFPVVMLEAASMALPVVATSVPGVTDAVISGVTGTLVPPRDSRALAEALVHYLDSPALGRAHGQAARSRVLAEFQREAMWRALREVYAQATGLESPLAAAEAAPHSGRSDEYS